MRSVVVTGVSSGIGWGCVKVLIANDFRVFGSVRSKADADRLSEEFGANFAPLIFDVTDAAAVVAAAKQVEAALRGETLSGLVNNAGVAVPGPLLHLKVDDFKQQLAVNLVGPLIVTQAFAPLLGAGGSPSGRPGRIVMISSVGGRNGSPFLGAYCASKFGLEGMSESLRRELMTFGVDVIVIAPGAVATPIWEKGEAVDVAQYANTRYAPALAKIKQFMIENGRKGLPAERLGEAVMKALTVETPRARYTVGPDPLRYLITSILPKRMLDKMIARRLGLERPPAIA